MANRRKLLPVDLQQLLDLIEKGKLFAVQDWIKTGKRHRIPENPETDAKVLRAAVSTGFHSLIEELLRVGGWSQKELAEGLKLARHQNALTSPTSC